MIVKKIKQLSVKTKYWIFTNPILSFFILVLICIYYFSLPKQLFNPEYSSVIESREGKLIGATIAKDGQWRFPIRDSIPENFQKCILLFEDEHFFWHPGFNPISIAKAIVSNSIYNTKIGASTISQQTIRLFRKNKKRTYLEKSIELLLATRLELKYSKKEILNLYVANAPFGGNVVGLEMASYRYFGRDPFSLSWSEVATLAVLPNAPSLIYPGKNQEKLLLKRNKLLKKLLDKKIIDDETFSLSLLEKLPEKPHLLPQIATHLTSKLTRENPGKRIRSTIHFEQQKILNTIVQKYYDKLKQQEIYNLAILVLDIEKNEVVNYIGNSPTNKEHHKDVDIIHAPRSTGSILKPILHTAMLDAGELLPRTLVADIPTQISGYSPENYSETYEGAVPANEALAKSLNIPAVRLLQEFGINRFYHFLKKLKHRNIRYKPDHYGLSLILGGAESNLWDICNTYKGFSHTLNYYETNNQKYDSNTFDEPKLILSNIKQENPQKDKLIFSAGAIWNTYQALIDVNRPEEYQSWNYFNSKQKIAWKTGTSFGNRDAWAIGSNKKYIIGVWVGNADGEGRPLLTGRTVAGPILFDIFNYFHTDQWFQKPFESLKQVTTCFQSGYLAGQNCTKTKVDFIPNIETNHIACPYHIKVHLNEQKTKRVNSNCFARSKMKTESWFKLPPVMEWYYRLKDVNYKTLPPFDSNCFSNENTLDFIYPKHNETVTLTKDYSGKKSYFIAKAAYNPNKQLHWYVDNRYLASTSIFHELDIKLEPGKYYISITNDFGHTKKIKVDIK